MGAKRKPRPAKRKRRSDPTRAKRARSLPAEGPVTVPYVVRCNDCGTQFKIVPQMETTPDEGEVHYFACPECHRVYVMARITARGVALRSSLAAIQKRAKTSQGEVRARLLRQAEQIRWELGPEVSGAEG